jgi:hypothetical protein
MTIAELLAAVAAAIVAAFADADGWAVWDGPPDATALPAVWPELASTYAAGARATGSATTVQIVAVIAPQTSPAETATVADAHDRLDTIGPAAIGAAIQTRQAVLGPVDIGQITHTALLYSLTLDRPLPC